MTSSLSTSETKAKPDFLIQTYIRCSLDMLWDALTDPAFIARYHFLTEHVRKHGGTTHYDIAPDVAIMKARGLTLTPKTRIEQTLERHWEGRGTASRTVEMLSEEGDVCSLTLEHCDLILPVVDGEGIAGGWARLLSGLKTYLETGETIRFREEAVA